MAEGAAPHPKDAEGPIRILVQTRTHLVPGEGWTKKKIIFMMDLVCQRHFHRRFDPREDRDYTHGTEFGYHNRRCYFLLDHGQSQNDDDVPVAWYEWTGDSLKELPNALPLDIKSELKQYPFTKPPPGSRPKRPPWDAHRMGRRIRHNLRSEKDIWDHELDFMRDHPEAESWLEKHVEHRFWLNYEALVRQRDGSRDGQG